ncbi:L,D-transpeptidase [Tardiphaga sp.]|jgi:lipoprotein-anchoring transpeptidase ErfK/SrfK|uniref:L,D-transpeptidase n=1 Tax=Tardiphaga sp. TaxID=1926292 RepID=UPI0025F9F07A|nr:L,D-transpeptidase [Tardiphaga sp.]
MMIKHVLTIFATVAVSAAGHSLALAQGYPAPAQSGYSIPADPSYPPGGYPADVRARSARDAVPDFDALDEDDAPSPRGRPMTALPAPGPAMAPDDSRYGRPAGAPAYSERAPQGPVMSPDDPRYGRPMGPPAVIYSDRPATGQPQTYSDRGYDDNRAIRPPEGVGAQGGGMTSSVQPSQGGDRPVQLSALPVEEQPENGPAQLPPNLRRQEVNFVTKEPAGTIVVDTPNTYLYYVLGNNRAIRYGVRVGRDGFTWTGMQKITRKAEWPDWHPPTEMIERQPYLPRFMAGGPGNPLGARAMYLGSTVYRIHGTNQPSTIGKFVSSGCIGMINEDVSDLFERTKVGTRVVVMPGGAPPTTTASAQPIPGPNASNLPPAPLAGTQPMAVQPLPAPVTIR